jgi:phosphatidylserine/phosphatidylglycerophosphate/cardiolipin synthase-like enzyme
VFQLGAAITRGVKVLVVVPSATEEAGALPRYQKFQRDIGVAYLQSVATKAGRRDDFTIVALGNGNEDICVHSKLLIVDDEYVLLGPANVNQKSMTHDSEVDIGVVDADSVFAQAFRVSTWSEHLAVPPKDVVDITAGYALMVKAARRKQCTGHVIGYEVNVSQPMGHGRVIRRIDPYAGPPR